MRILSVGEVLCDVFAHSEHIGGAPLNFAFHAACLGHEVEMVSAVGRDPRGKAILEFAREARVGTRFLQSLGDYPTGVVSVHFTDQGQPVYEIERPAAYQHVNFTEADCAVLKQWDPQGIYFGTLFHTNREALQTTERILATCDSAARFYDVNLRTGAYTPELVRKLAQMATILKLNNEEAPEVAGLLGTPFSSFENFARGAAIRYGYQAVCITRGAEGCSILWNGRFLECPGYPAAVMDTVGAGDAFSAAFLHGWMSGWSPEDTCDFANRVGALIAGRSGGTPQWSEVELPLRR